MLESVREINGHVNKQLTNHSSATEREIAEELARDGFQQFSCSTRYKLGNSDVRQATLLSDNVEWQNDFVTCLTWALDVYYCDQLLFSVREPCRSFIDGDTDCMFS